MRDENLRSSRYKKMKNTRKNRWTVKKKKRARSSTQPKQRERRVLNRNRTYGVLQWNGMEWNGMKWEMRGPLCLLLKYFPQKLSFCIRIFSFPLNSQTCAHHVQTSVHKQLMNFICLSKRNLSNFIQLDYVIQCWKIIFEMFLCIHQD